MKNDVDERDFRLFTKVLQDPFVSNERLGRHVGLSGTAVKERFARLAAEVAFQGFRAVPAAETLGRRGFGYFFADVDLSAEAMDAVLAAPDVVWVVAHHDRLASVLTYEAPESTGPSAALVQAMRSAPMLRIPTRLTPAQPPTAPLSPLDWRILRAYVPDPRRDFTQLAEATGLSRKTVARRLQELVAAHQVTLAPLYAEARASGAVLYHLIVLSADAAAVGRVQVLLGERGHAYAWVGGPPGVALVCHARSNAEALETRRQVAAVPGVMDVVFNIPLANGFAEARVLGWIDTALAQWSR